jgi:tRNA(adenine34) deaminase
MIAYRGEHTMDDAVFMDEALALAREAAAEGEVPVGCVIVRGNEIVGRGRNRRETARTALGHAEIEAIADACRNLGGWRLWDCTLYVTLEPCPMCAGAIINARIPKVVYGAADQKAGSCGSVCDLFSMEYNHHPQVICGVREEECAELLQQFFQDLRVTLRTRPKWKRPEA